MSSNYTQILACARSILEAIGPCAESEKHHLTLSGRSPYLRDVPSIELLARRDWDRLDNETRSRLSVVVQGGLSTLRDRLLRRYRQLAEQLYSPLESGMSDLEIENWLIQTFEARYDRSLDEIRSMFAKAIWRTKETVDNRNTRGAFGDVSHPQSLQANNSANPPNPRNSIQLHKIPPLNRNRPLVKIDFIGTSSSTSPYPFIHSFMLI
jgi:hypothetical protein